MNVLREPMSIEELKKKKDESGFVEGIVPVDISFLIENDSEVFYDTISEKLTGSSSLTNVSYNVVGMEDNATLLIEVTGDVSDILEAHGEGEDEETVE